MTIYGRLTDPATMPGLSFEEQTYEVSRRLAALSRRRFLAGSGALLAASAVSMPASAQRKGGNLRIGRSSDPDTLDPQKTTSFTSHETFTQIFDGMVMRDEKGNVLPHLALSWEFQNDNKRVVFKLRPNVVFHDGTPVNAEAVAFTVKRHLDPATASPTKFICGPLTHAEVVDDLTVAYVYTAPFVTLWVGLGGAYQAILSPTAVQKLGNDFGRNPVGSGPFKFDRWQPDSGIKLVRNDKHMFINKRFKNDKPAHLDSIEYAVIPEDAPRLAALQSNEIQVIAGFNAVPLDKLAQVKRMRNVKVLQRTALSCYGIAFNTKLAPTSDLKVRQALSMAIDKNKVLQLALGGNGELAYSVLGPAFPQVLPNAKDIAPKYDPAKARALLAEAGATNLKLRLSSNDDSTNRRACEVIQAEFKAVGVDVAIEAVPGAEAAVIQRKGEHPLYMVNYRYTDGDVLHILLHKTGSLNRGFYTTPRSDELLDQQRLEFDAKKRDAMLHEVQKIAIEQCWWLPLYADITAVAIRDNVEDFENAWDARIYYKDVWLKA
jgi:peptide/nickel transport system substrate-binding protein